MARRVQRNVQRTGAGGRQAIVRAYGRRRWYEMADWLVVFTVDYIGWAVLAVVVLLLPVTILAAVLGAHALPVEYLGIPLLDRLSNGNNSFGIAGIVLIIEFILLALAVRPLFKRHAKGWKLVIAAAAVHLAGSLVLQHAFSGIVLLLLMLYIYWQVKDQYAEQP